MTPAQVKKNLAVLMTRPHAMARKGRVSFSGGDLTVQMKFLDAFF